MTNQKDMVPVRVERSLRRLLKAEAARKGMTLPEFISFIYNSWKREVPNG